MRTNLEVKKVSEEYGFDYFVRFCDGEPTGAVLDVEIDTGAVYITHRGQDGSIPYDIWCGTTQRFNLYCIPTPEGANRLLDDEDVLGAIRDLIKGSDVYQDSQSNYRGRCAEEDVAHLEAEILKATPYIGKVCIMDASDFFGPDSDEEEVYEEFGFKEKEDIDVAEAIYEEFHGDYLDDNQFIFLTNVEEYVRSIREAVEG